MTEKALERVVLETVLRIALEYDETVIYFQPHCFYSKPFSIKDIAKYLGA